MNPSWMYLPSLSAAKSSHLYTFCLIIKTKNNFKLIRDTLSYQLKKWDEQKSSYTPLPPCDDQYLEQNELTNNAPQRGLYTGEEKAFTSFYWSNVVKAMLFRRKRIFLLRSSRYISNTFFHQPIYVIIRLCRLTAMILKRIWKWEGTKKISHNNIFFKIERRIALCY